MSGLLSGRGWIVAVVAFDGSTGTDEEQTGVIAYFPPAVSIPAVRTASFVASTYSTIESIVTVL
jgi:hypothetical protein